MPFAQELLVRFPVFTLGLIVIGAFVFFYIVGLLFVRRIVPHYKLVKHHDVAAPLLGALGAVYAVLLAFMVVTVWERFEKSESNAQMEANFIADLYRDAEAFSLSFRLNLNPLLRQYRNSIVEDEWKLMQKGQMSFEAERLISKIWALYVAYSPVGTTETVFFNESVRKLNLVRELRRQRLMDSKSGIHPLLWFVLGIGAVATISFTYLFGAENFKAQLIMGVILSAMIALIIFTILSLDYPFSGSVCILPDAFKEMILD